MSNWIQFRSQRNVVPGNRALRVHLWVACIIGLITSVAAANADTRLSLGSRSGNAGDALSTPIEVASDEGLVGLQLDIGYVAEDVSLTGIVEAELATDHVVRSAELVAGQSRLLVYSPTNTVLPNGVIANAGLDLLNGFESGSNAFNVSKIRFVTQTGSVLNVSLAPFVRLQAPTENSLFNELDEVNLSALTVDNDSPVTRVEFVADGRVIASSAAAPFSATWVADELGNALLSVVAYDADGDRAESPQTQITVSQLAFLQAWREANFSSEQLNDNDIVGLGSDPENDGVANIFEFAYGLDPQDADLAGLPKVAIEIGDDGNEYLTLEYQKPIAVTELDYITEVSTDLLDWVSDTASIEIESLGDDGAIERFRARVTEPLSGESGEPSVFIRSRVQAK